MNTASNTGNIGWHFYKGYYEGVDFAKMEDEINAKKLRERNTALYRKTLAQPPHPLLESEGIQQIVIETQYPGLLMGTGYAHEAIRADEEFKTGFAFDYTTGLPTLTGSSMKGILRSMFPGADFKNAQLKEKANEMAEAARYRQLGEAKQAFIAALLQPLQLPVQPNILELEIEIFGSIAKSEDFNKGSDEFLGGFLTGPEGKAFLGDDYITPHGNPIKNPNPVKLLKVMPGIQFTLAFDLKSGLLSVSQKLELFKAIIAFKGIGAKTNVGYGNVSILSETNRKSAL